MRLFIPETGCVITLAEDWVFTVLNERGNYGLSKLMGFNVNGVDWYHPFGTRVPNVEEEEISDDHQNYGRRRVPVQPGQWTFKAGTQLELAKLDINKFTKTNRVHFKVRHSDKRIYKFVVSVENANQIVI